MFSSSGLSLGVEEAAVDNCPERMDAADAEALRPPRIETVVEFCPRMAVESMELETAVDICPERMHAAAAEAPRRPRIETAVEF